ncbi:MAG: winged helix-turn-helix domain-containing protein [Nannocystaceae bacterium]
MTFLEAAIEVLREAAEPLHFTEVAKRAVEGNLLSHVGRDPDAAMRTCLMSAVRKGRDGADPIIIREKTGVYGLRPGAVLPDPPPRPAAKARTEAPKTSSKSVSSVPEDEATGEAPERKRRRRTKARGEAPAPASVEVLPARKTTKKTTKKTAKKARSRDSSRTQADSEPAAATAKAPIELSEEAAAAIKEVQFEAPQGSGLDGVTDVALVMANAMSRLVDERPELKDELEAMQQAIEDEAARVVKTASASPRQSSSTSSSSSSRSNGRGSAGQQDEERGGRRRRRRRRRGKRVDWSNGANARSAASNLHDKLLDNVSNVLEEAGSRSLHVRQIAETLASKGVLGGEISEIERAVTAAILLDIRTYERASRFTARGDARYQLQGTRLPDKASKAEQTLRNAARVLETETRAQIIQWLQSLGARALESLVRIYLHREGFTLLSALPPSRGLGKLVVEDPDPDDEESRLLVLVVPRRTALEPKAWDGELERNHCGGVVLFMMGEADESSPSDARVINSEELGQWMIEQRVGVTSLRVDVPAIDATFIESIGGLDT